MPAELTCAQAILESGWMSRMSGSANPFGIKGTPQNGTLCSTKEWFTPGERDAFLRWVPGRTATISIPPQTNANGRTLYIVQDWFRNYESLAEAFAAHASLIANNALYRPALDRYKQDRNLSALIEGVAVHYATDSHYAAFVKSIAMSAVVKQAIEAARAAVGSK